MEFLAEYDSSSSYSSTTTRTTRQNFTASQSTNRNHDPIFTRGEQDALSVNASDDSHRVGRDGHCSPRKAHDDSWDTSRGNSSGSKRVASTRKQVETNLNVDTTEAAINSDISHAEKLRKTRPISAAVESRKRRRPNVIVMGYDDCPAFERSHPHWEGRWVGHLCLPFPPLEYLDLLSINGEVSKNGREKDRVLESEGNICQGCDRGCISGRESSDSSSDDEEDDMPESRLFLYCARNLIKYLRRLLEDDIKNAAADSEEEVIAIIPHIPMHHDEMTMNSTTSRLHADESLSRSLHISLARPICLPAPSVDPFLADIKKQMNSVLCAGKGKNNTIGKTVYLQPHNATIFTNDQQTRSFLGIPVSNESSRWVKQLLLPPIDDAMLRFGLDTYYSSEEAGCILHVSFASVKGNIIPQIQRRRKPGTVNIDIATAKSVSLFSDHHTPTKADTDILESIPLSIPIRVNQIQCQFGKTKQLSIPF